jgi:hypothetical protein
MSNSAYLRLPVQVAEKEEAKPPPPKRPPKPPEGPDVDIVKGFPRPPKQK